jgi:hypothetical protein
MNLTRLWAQFRVWALHDCPQCFSPRVRTKEGYFCSDCFLAARDRGARPLPPPPPAPPPKDAA